MQKRRMVAGLAGGALTVSGLTLSVFVGAPSAVAADDTNPDFGPNVTIIDPSMTTEQINAAIAPVAGNPRRQIFFKPGTYGSAAGQNDPSTATGIVNTTLNANTAIGGLGAQPNDVRINGALHVEAAGSALGTFARTLTNLSINPIQPGEDPHTMRWLTSQTAHWRRIDLRGDVDLTNPAPGTFAFGNVIANSRITGKLDVGNGQNTAEGQGDQTNAMYYTRNSQIGGWEGFSSKMVFSGVKGAPKDNFGPATAKSGPGDKVTLKNTPVTREAPFLYVDRGHYKVFVPKARTNTSGYDWDLNSRNGSSLALSRFYIANPTATAATLNQELAKGKNLLLTPGVYDLDAPLQVNRPDTVIMGLGFAQLNATAGLGAVKVGNVPGVVLSAFSVGGTGTASDVLVQIGSGGAKRGGSEKNPTTISDVHIAGKAVTAEVINQDHVLVDGSWVRTGGLGGVAWSDPAGSHGIVVNGDDVTWTGLWVEHFKKTQMTWNGDGGQVVFLETEPPYTPPSQPEWMNGAKEGYPTLKIADDVKSFRLDGFGAYTRFSNGCVCFASSAIETPVKKDIVFHGVTAGSIMFPVPGGFTKGGFRHIFNDLGPAVDAGLDSGNSRLPYSDTFGFTSNLRIALFPTKADLGHGGHR
ncbi:hypothetical protein EDD29_5719 [Actinocorallia herbida]|uniref:Pectate lyase-like protein n=2 Tax=Actinocorallia herbida TaxID=58109 RepID=A0A3N1D3G8_9ACTN|nr:hypothetical protein EDD29_5719 [Actinocorallia herbida]